MPVVRLHPIRVAARRAGLTPDLLRVWEQRYGAVSPARSERGQRRYSDTEVERLRLLRLATEAGRRIGDVARMNDSDLRRMVDEDRRARPDTAVEAAPPGRVEELLAECVRAVRAFDDARLGAGLTRASLVLTPDELVERLVGPLMRRIGDLWRTGEIDPAHEHMATALVRGILTQVIASLPPKEPHRRMVVATPAGERHEIGALLVATSAAASGWAITYLGADLPAASIVRAALAVDARAVALSAVSPADPDHAIAEILDVRERLRGILEVFAGGASAVTARERLERAGVHVLEDVAPLVDALQGMVAAAS